MRMGVDLGGTKIEAIMIDHEGLEVLRHRVAAPQNDYKTTLQAIKDLVQRTEKAWSQGGCDRKNSGRRGYSRYYFARNGLVKNANSTCLIGHHLDRDLAEILDRPVKIANDANCFALRNP